MREWQVNFKKCITVGNFEGAIRILRKTRMSKEYLTMTVREKIMLDYCLVFSYEKSNKMDFANIYISSMFELLNSDIFTKSENIDSYCRAVWISVNVNKDTLTKEEITESMIEVAMEYKKMGVFTEATLAIANIYSATNDGEGLYNYLIEIINKKTHSKRIVNEILVDIKKIDQDTYIKALKFIKNSNLEMVN